MSQGQPMRPQADDDNHQQDGQSDAAMMTQSAANKNERATEAEFFGGQGVGQDGQKSPVASPSTMKAAFKHSGITIGEALEATALTAGNRPVDYTDAAAIQAAEVRATCRNCIIPGGVAAAAQSAATRNARATRDEDKTKLAEILADASTKLPSDKPVTRRDAEGVIGAEIRNDPNLCTRPGGVAASLAAAARLNQSYNSGNK